MYINRPDYIPLEAWNLMSKKNKEDLYKNSKKKDIIDLVKEEEECIEETKCKYKEYYNKLPYITDNEEDMLDLAYGLTHTSRLGRQIVATNDINGIKLIIPHETRNININK